MTNPETTLGTVIERLFAVIESRRDSAAEPAQSYTASLFAGGPERIAQKVGEEAIETVIAALGDRRQAVAEESADLLYHLLVLWAAADLTPAEIGAVLAQREGASGLSEKAARRASTTTGSEAGKGEESP